MNDRPLPNCLLSEQSLLGALTLDWQLIIGLSLQMPPEAFYSVVHQRLFIRMQELAKTGGFTAEDLLMAAQGEEMQALLDITAKATTSANWERYAQKVIQLHSLRILIRTGSDLASKAFDTSAQPDDLLKEVNDRINEIRCSRANTTHEVKDLIDVVYEEATNYVQQEKVGGLTTGIKALDQYFKLDKGALIVIGARPSIGKSALMMNIAAVNSITHQKRGLIFSLEMSSKNLVDRMVCGHARIDRRLISKQRAGVTQEQYETYARARDQFKASDLTIVEDGNLNVSQIRLKALQENAKRKLDFIMVDYLQIVKVIKNHSRDIEIGEISSGLKQLAKEINVPVVLLAQLNRQGEETPKMSHLRESGQVEQDADVIALLHRKREQQAARQDQYKNLLLSNKPFDDLPALDSEALICKNRSGPIGKAKLSFIPEQILYTDRIINRNYEGPL